MKMRNKGKIHPFTSTSSSSSSSSSSSTQANNNSNNDVVFPVLNLLPVSIFTLLSLLSFQEREVLAYMVSRSLKNPLTSNTNKNKNNKKLSNQTHDALFDCDCFHCYTSFWFRWDSSPNRELIHQAIEAFEEHLNTDESSRNGKNKKKEKMGRRKNDKNVILEEKTEFPEKVDFPASVTAEEEVETAEEVVAPVVVVEGHRGLARKVLPDVMGIFNSRLWRLWSPNA